MGDRGGICLYTETALPIVGGQELAVDALARQFAALDRQPTVLTLRLPHGRTADDAGLPYPVERHRRFVSSRYFLSWYGRSLDRLHLKRPFDVLHCHNVYPAGYVAALWTAQRGVPLVVTSHACDIAPDGRILKKRSARERMNFVLQRADAVVAISAPVAERLVELGADPRKIAAIPNGVDTARYRRSTDAFAVRQTTLRPGKFLLFLGRLVRRKGADLLLDAFRRIVVECDADLVIAGAGSQEDELRRLAELYGVRNRVHLIGVVAGEAKDYLLQNAICTVIPSRISEGSSLTALESFAAGRPVVASDVPGLREAVRPFETGLLFPENDAQALSDALSYVVARSHDAERWGAAARRYVAPFDWRRIAERHLELYDSLTARGTTLRRAA